MSMEVVDRLEERFNDMLKQIKELKQENQLLRQEVERGREARDTVRERIESLLGRVQQELD